MGYDLEEGKCYVKQECHSTCKDCDGPEATSCISCHQNAYIKYTNDTDVSECTCKVNFEPQPDAANCVSICAENCFECEGPEEG